MLIPGIAKFQLMDADMLTDLPGRIRHKWGKALYRVFTLLFINFQWVLFNAKDLPSGLAYIGKMILYSPNPLADARALFLLKDYGFFIAAAILLCFPVVPWLDRKLRDRKVLHLLAEAVLALILAAAFAWAVSLVVAGLNNPFAYTNF